MRITQNMLSDRVLKNLWQNMTEMDKLNDQISSGKKFTRPSDDPSGVLNSMRLTSAIGSSQQFAANIDQGIGLLNTTEGALTGLGDILNRAKELAVQGATSTVDVNGRHAIAQEILQLKDQAKVIANTDQGGRYVFAGTNFYVPPWNNSNPPGAEWVGNDDYVKYQIGQSTALEVNIPGRQVFVGNPPGVPGLMDTLDKLYNNLEAGNIQDVASQDIQNIQTNLDKVLRIRVELGARVNRLQMAKDRLTDQANNLTGLLSKNQDIDLAEVISTLKSTEDTYKASLAASARIIQPTLMDFLK